MIGWRRWMVAALLAGGVAGVVQAQSAPPAPSSPPDAAARPRVALVLSGGGARGFAHVGVLRVLEELRVPVDIVVGASMGAVVGGAYAAGRPVAELDAFVRSTDWVTLVADRPQRQDLSFRRKDDDLEVPSRLEFALGRAGLTLPPAAAANAAVEDALARLLPLPLHTAPLSSLPVRFRAVATDLLTGDLVDLADTPLLPALRATMSVPGVYAPVRVDGRLVVDGGLVRNLPVDLARSLGADVIIAVNVGTPLSGPEALGSALGVAQQMFNILTEQNVQRSIRELTGNDILIAPDLTGVSFLDFSAAPRALAAGERAARAAAAQLARLTIDRDAYAAREAARTQRRVDPDLPQPLARLEVQGTQWADARALAAESGLDDGEPVTRRDIERAAERLRGRGDFDRVGIAITDHDGVRDVVLTPTESEWARSRLRIGLELSSDFREDHRFTVSGLHVLSWINRWGGELRTIGRLGSQRSLATEWWQPLGPGAPWYVSTTLGHRAESNDLFLLDRRVARIGLSVSTASLALGTSVGRHGDLRVGVDRNVGQTDLLLPVDDEAVARFAESNAFVQLRWDTLENLAFPTQGQLLYARWERFKSQAIDEPSLASSRVQLMTAMRLGTDWGGHLYGEWSKSSSGYAPLALGGFLRLSGAPRQSILGGTVLLGRMVVARRIGQLPAGIGGAIRAGASLELGNGFGADESVRFSKLRIAGSAFVSVDTRFGPAYLALGGSRGASTVYVFLGPFW